MTDVTTTHRLSSEISLECLLSKTYFSSFGDNQTSAKLLCGDRHVAISVSFCICLSNFLAKYEEIW